ncbi:MAG: glycosyltransferase, partial [Ardenticatenaceae bacterium]
ALACGLPLVTTANAGSVMRDGCEGFLVPVADSTALAGRLEQLRANERLRREMSRAARARAEQFTWDIYQKALVEAYSRIVTD